MDRLDELDGRIARLEQTVQHLVARLDQPQRLLPPPVPVQSGVPDDILNLARQGKKIDAIKRARQLFGFGLAEAKDYVENLDGMR